MSPDDMVKTAIDVAEEGMALRLAVNVEPCLMCLGAAMALKVTEVYYGLESPADGGSAVAATWPTNPDLPWYVAPTITGGIRRAEVQGQFRRYCDRAPESGFRSWAASLTTLPERQDPQRP
jgi:tRNA(adenine34) deaminase